MQAVYFDVIRSYLEYVGYEVTYVRNYTDVDDKIIARAREQSVEPLVLAQRMIDQTEKDMEGIGCRPPTFSPRVSTSMPEIISMIETLVAKDFAYQTPAGDVYYRVGKKKDYGKLSGRKTDELLNQSRELKGSDGKEDPLDFALWKADPTPGASWPSPWSSGRPGWHIECSAMAKQHLGCTIDIHGGGLDLKFPHHENEIAQSEAANDAPFANYWLHNGLLTIEKQKMSKSLGNHITVKQFLEEWPGEVLRLAFLTSHYRSQCDFSHEIFVRSLQRLVAFYAIEARALELRVSSSSPDAEQVRQKEASVMAGFDAAMADDFNTPAALASLSVHLAAANEALGRLELGRARKGDLEIVLGVSAGFKCALNVLGLLKENAPAFLSRTRALYLAKNGLTETKIEEAIAARQQARAAKDFKKSDEIRDDLLNRGIILKDLPRGTEWDVKIA